MSAEAKVFTTFDALKGYHQCPLDEESQLLTTFITPIRTLDVSESTVWRLIHLWALQPPHRHCISRHVSVRQVLPLNWRSSNQLSYWSNNWTWFLQHSKIRTMAKTDESVQWGVTLQYEWMNFLWQIQMEYSRPPDELTSHLTRPWCTCPLHT